MIKPIDLLAPPDRKEEPINHGGWRITVTPPEWTGFKGASLILTDDQYRRYKMWRNTNCLIQYAFPDLTNSEREILMSGIGPDDFLKLEQDDE